MFGKNAKLNSKLMDVMIRVGHPIHLSMLENYVDFCKKSSDPEVKKTYSEWLAAANKYTDLVHNNFSVEEEKQKIIANWAKMTEFMAQVTPDVTGSQVINEKSGEEEKSDQVAAGIKPFKSSKWAVAAMVLSAFIMFATIFVLGFYYGAKFQERRLVDQIGLMEREQTAMISKAECTKKVLEMREKRDKALLEALKTGIKPVP